MKNVEKVIDFLGKPINFNIILATFFTSFLLLLLNFLPPEYLVRFHIENFFDKYGFIVLIVFFISFFLLFLHLITNYRSKKEDKAATKFYLEQQDELFDDMDALLILVKLFQSHPNAVHLPLYNQKVKLLEQFGLITKATNQAIVNMENPYFPYILQPIAEEKLESLDEKKLMEIDSKLKDIANKN